MELLETEPRFRREADHDEYRELLAQHKQYEKQLEQIGNRRPFTQEDWFEASVLKKRKLMVKDRIASLGRQSAAAPARRAI